jgi:hypothetical protein
MEDGKEPLQSSKIWFNSFVKEKNEKKGKKKEKNSPTDNQSGDLFFFFFSFFSSKKSSFKQLSEKFSTRFDYEVDE